MQMKGSRAKGLARKGKTNTFERSRDLVALADRARFRGSDGGLDVLA
jgi:hypothetical protein